MSIGTFQPDENKEHIHGIVSYSENPQDGFFVSMTRRYVSTAVARNDLGNIFFNKSGGKESTPASISAYVCIKY
jgi:hypothetical protein